MLYIVTKGTHDATLASVPLHIATNGSLEVGWEGELSLCGAPILTTNLPAGAGSKPPGIRRGVPLG